MVSVYHCAGCQKDLGTTDGCHCCVAYRLGAKDGIDAARGAPTAHEERRERIATAVIAALRSNPNTDATRDECSAEAVMQADSFIAALDAQPSAGADK